ncbi:MAG: hypothetical protein MUP47_04845 [Phycisphaerae bacterium]|nr:hypothetical protein [Phycisphaerae bacterium]
MLWFVAAAVLLAAAGQLQPVLVKLGSSYELVQDSSPGGSDLEALLTIAPGGLRAPVVNYLWIRAEDLKQKGKFYDAMQLAELICSLQPYFPGVWSFHSWNMAWNISVATHTPEERWMWVTNGMRLLRDRGVPKNPRSLILYKDLAWVFFSKMGSNLDDMHVVYKQRWAAEMQRLLGSPPQDQTSEVIDAFRPIASAPVDKAPPRQGRQDIQADQLALVTADPSVGEYVRLLADQGVTVGWSLLDAYNRFSRDSAVEIVRLQPPTVSTPAERAISDLINSPDHAAARGKLLAFVRAQLLWNVYRMDPSWMLAMMEKYQAPIDWRLVWPHGLYWASYGLKASNDVPIDKIDAINTDRISLGCLKALTAAGRMTYLQNPDRPEQPSVDWYGDWRYIDATHQEYLATIEAYSKASQTEFEQNAYRTGHINYLVLAMQMLYVQGKVSKAEYYYDWIREHYHPEGEDWTQPMEGYLLENINRDSMVSEDIARTHITAALQMAYVFLAAGDFNAYQGNMRYARRVYDVYQGGSKFARIRLRPLESIASYIAAAVLTEPYCVGYHLSLIQRSQLYGRLDDATRVLAYDRLAGSKLLRDQCDREGLDFDKAFPAPAGLQEYRQQQRQQMLPGQQPAPQELPAD